MSPSSIPQFDVFRSHDGTVSKYIHEDGSETSIKRVLSTQNIFNPLTRQVETRESDRNKYSIFISSSVGCFMKCQFCHLTLKQSEHHKLTSDQVLSNLKEAVEDAVHNYPELRQRYVKLSWMGMGDAINKHGMVHDVTLSLLEWIFEKGYALGLDGVDLSTVMPQLPKKEWIPTFWALEERLQNFPRNPVYHMDNVEYTNHYYSHRNIFRLFYSVSSAIQERRDAVIPHAMPLEQVHEHFKEYQKQGQYPVILHHLLVDGLNDSPEELDALIAMCKEHYLDNELRILRYNYCANSPFKESSRFISQIEKLSRELHFIKVQISPGTEVSAACGQFIVKDFIRIKKDKHQK